MSDEYLPPNGDEVGLAFEGEYTPPDGNQIGLNFTNDPGGDVPPVETQYLFPAGATPGEFGSVLVPVLRTFGWQQEVVSQPLVWNYEQYIKPSGINKFGIGKPSIKNLTDQLFPSGFIGTGFGDAFVENFDRYLGASGWASFAAGSATIENASPNLTPDGWDSFAAGGATVTNFKRYLSPSGWLSQAIPASHLVERTPSFDPAGFASSRFGAPTIWFFVRELRPDGLSLAGYGNATRVEYEIRYVAASGIAPPGVAAGTPKVEFRDRIIAPPSIWKEFPSAHVIGWAREIAPTGFVATRWGERIIPEQQQVNLTTGIKLPGFGVPEAFNRNRVIRIQDGIYIGEQPGQRWGYATVWNLLQIVEQYHDEESAAVPPAWSKWTTIENRNRVIGPVGTTFTKYGRPYVYNNARLLEPGGFMPAGPSAFMVAYRVRELPIPGMPSPYITSWTVVYNDAHVVQAHGAPSDAAFGQASVESNRRTYAMRGWDDFGRGFPMVSFAVREITFESRYGIAPPVITSQHAVALLTRYVAYAGAIGARGVGAPELRIHWNIIAPAWGQPSDRFGSPTARNLTPEVGTYGRNHQEFGQAQVRLEFRFVQGVGQQTDIIPAPTIAFRDRQFQAFGFHSFRFGHGLVVTRTGAPPYSTQTIDLSLYEGAENAYKAAGNGIWPPGGSMFYDSVQVPPPALNQQVVYPDSEEPMTKWGVPFVTSSVIRPDGIVEYKLVGDHRVEAKIRYIECDSEHGYPPIAPNLYTQVPKQRVSPHTIYAVMESPPQAQANHPLPANRFLHYVGAYTYPPGERFGTQHVSLRDRPIKPAGIAWIQTQPGVVPPKPAIRNARHYIKPAGIKSWQFGWPQVPGPRTVEQVESADTSAFGTASIAPPPYTGPQEIRPDMLAATEFGENRVELFNREVQADGWASQRFGASKPGDRPYMWQGLHVGPPVPLVAGGDDTSLYGDDALVAHRVREVRPEGFDAFLSEYDIAGFGARMRVTRREEHVPIEFIMTHGAQHDRAGVPDVRNRVHYIIPDGDAETYRKGAHHA